jgi:hypothetical protein
VINGTDNTAATPALTGTDTDTGVFFPAANTMAFSTGGTEQVRVTSTGDVGVGTSSPSGAAGKNLTIYNSSGQSRAAFKNSVTGDASGDGFQVGIDGDGVALLDQRENLEMRFSTNATERMRIDSSGNLLVGATSNIISSISNKVVIANVGGNSEALGTLRDTTGGIGHIGFYNPNGRVGEIFTNGSATTYSTSSDYRLKENIAPMIGALDVVSALKPVTYNWKVDGSNGQGFIAHELQEVVPDCVTGEKDAVETVDEFDEDGKKIGTKEVPRYQGIDTSFLVATLTAAIQELKATVDAQAARIAALENPPAPTPVES